MLKKLLIGIGIFVVIVVAGLAALPLFYSVDSMRPKIEQAINQSIRGKVELGKLSMSALPSLKISADGIVATAPAPFNSSPLAKVKRVEVVMPLYALFFAPRATLVIDEAAIVLSSKGNESSLNAFLPAAQTSAAAATPTKEPPKAVGESLTELPGFVRNRIAAARLAFEIKNSDIRLVDELASKNDKKEFHKVNLRLGNIGIDAPIQISALLDLDIVSGATTIRGESKSSGTVRFKPQGNVNLISYELNQNLDAVEISMPPTFRKASGTTLGADLKGTFEQSVLSNLNLEELKLHFGDLTLAGFVKIASLGDENAASLSTAFSATKVALAPFGTFVPLIRDYKLGGNLDLDVKASGFLKDPTFDLNVVLSNVKGSTPQLKHPINDLDATIRVSGSAKNPVVNVNPLKFKIASSDVGLAMKIVGAENPNIDVKLNSKRFDGDELLGLQTLQLDKPLTEAEIEQEKAEKKATKEAIKAARSGGPALPSLDENLDKLAPQLEESLKNPMLDKVKANLSLQIANAKFMGATFNDVALNANYAKRALIVNRTGLKGYKGALSLDMNLALNPKALGYKMTSKLSNVDVEEIIEVHAQSWRGQVSGRMNADFNLNGQGLRKTQLAQNLGGGLNGNLQNGSIKIPIMKLLGGVISSLPGGKKVNTKDEFKGQFKTAQIKSSIEGRTIKLNDLDIVYDSLQTGIGDLRFQATGSLSFERQIDVTGTCFVEPGKIPLAGLRGGSGKDEIPMRFKGDMADPQPDYAYTAKILGPKLAKGYLASEAGQKAQEKVKEKIAEEIKQKAPEELKGKIEDLKKKFKF